VISDIQGSKIPSRRNDFVSVLTELLRADKHSGECHGVSYICRIRIESPLFSSSVWGYVMTALKIGVVMGSQSDWPVMEHAVKQLEAFGVPVEAKVVSAHRTPDLLFEYAESARVRGLACIIAGAGGAAHLPGMLASKSTVPVLGVPVPSKYLKGMDSLLSIVQMPKGIPVATFAIGEAGAANAALYAVSILAVQDSTLAEKLDEFRRQQHAAVLEMKLPPKA
jgi:5-(carboxyamino)imidazole ribonucleotide mutase